ncbi:MAG: DUF4492 domain-containing protein [Bacteroidales bacterium]|nr:DUF4492 domain-containing protein [Bacteroidales bacterium]
MKSLISLPVRVFRFYYDGFRGMTVGKKLWIIILIKLFIFFFVLKLFFFPDLLKKNFPDDRARSNFVIEQLTK